MLADQDTAQQLGGCCGWPTPPHALALLLLQATAAEAEAELVVPPGCCWLPKGESTATAVTLLAAVVVGGGLAIVSVASLTGGGVVVVPQPARAEGAGRRSASSLPSTEQPIWLAGTS